MNSGGFDMLWSGRGRFSGEEDYEKALNICKEYRLDALVIIGGDGSNSNTALIANYFNKVNHNTRVIGVPKTIDGDLKSSIIECTFGFDSCSKTYSELIGNLCTDTGSSQKTYHFVRIMGRSASHLVLECALQTRPNLVYIGEEVRSRGQSIKDIVDDVCELIIARKAKNKLYGLVLIPEGLIEFIPGIDSLIQELNELIGSKDFSDDLLSESSRTISDVFPDMIRSQLLGDREATGYIQVAKIQTERLLILMIEDELHKRGLNFEDDGLEFMPHYFGYEGRCAF